MSVGGKYVTAFTGGSPISGFENIGDVAIDTNPGSGDYSLGNFVGGILETYDTSGYVIITDTTNAGVVGRPTGNNSGSISQPNQPTYWVSPTKDDAGFLFLINRLPARSGQTPFTDASVASAWLTSNGYWSTYVNPVVNTDLTLKLDAADSSSYPGYGSTWYDLQSPQQNVTLINNPTWTSGTPAYFTFNGSNQRGSGSGGTGVVPQTSYTKSMWFYMNAYADNNIMSSDVGGHFMYFASTNRLYSGHSNWGNYSAYPSTATFNLNTWYYAALTFNTTDGMKLYINGTLDSTYTANKNAHAGDGSINIASFGLGNLLNGRVGKVYCYSRSLTANEVLQNYNADKAHFGY
jgi:hypothetical protein